MPITTRNKHSEPVKASTSPSSVNLGSVNLGSVKVAGIQMASSPQVSSNLTEAERLIAIAAEQGAKIVVLPEYFCIMA